MAAGTAPVKALDVIAWAAVVTKLEADGGKAAAVVFDRDSNEERAGLVDVTVLATADVVGFENDVIIGNWAELTAAAVGVDCPL